ncbi:lytic transglycosylase domain-containing protein [Ramlibacter sp. USB13]|uniref:Lytic transglycosylase domain-containing protein n=1 Tax=Ramlibacter cellulosilyticus TaxID=2764187 RepID=A0A923MNS7_9BURK|nr:lytic transglycosylase domain-containing protein [Ramlibacter cellulosilyticus]MBC5782430.1 lytic transglycosylase domain-containing protein [Ramlibacter cellulosilyticus]
MRRLACAVLFAAALAASPARAEVWGYVDEKGVAHFAAEQLDARYELFFRGGESFDTAEGVQTPREVAVPTKSASKLLAYFDISPSYKQVKHHLREASREHGIDLELLQALIATESGFDTAAVSPKGAVGLMQIMPATAERYGVRGDGKTPVARKLVDPRTNVRTGTRYLRDLIRMFPGRLELALAAYNAGEGAVQRAGNRIPNYRETQNYVKTVMQLYGMLKPPAMTASSGGSPPKRVQMELPGPAARRNLPPGMAAAAPPPGPEAETVLDY